MSAKLPAILKSHLLLPLLLVVAGRSVGFAAAPLAAPQNFEKHCVDCHGSDGKSQTRLGRKSGAKDLSDKAAMAKLSDEDVFKTIKFGRKDKKGQEKMEAFGADMTDKEITELVALVRSFSK